MLKMINPVYMAALTFLLSYVLYYYSYRRTRESGLVPV